MNTKLRRHQPIAIGNISTIRREYRDHVIVLGKRRCEKDFFRRLAG
jgi:hypothetical protein